MYIVSICVRKGGKFEITATVKLAALPAPGTDIEVPAHRAERFRVERLVLLSAEPDHPPDYHVARVEATVVPEAER